MEDVLDMANKMNEIILDVGRKYAKSFEEDNLKLTDALINLGGCRKMMVWLYCLLRNQGKLPALETLPKDQKEEMWAFIKDVCGEKRNDRGLCRQMMMAFYALEYFLNENK